MWTHHLDSRVVETTNRLQPSRSLKLSTQLTLFEQQGQGRGPLFWGDSPATPQERTTRTISAPRIRSLLNECARIRGSVIEKSSDFRLNFIVVAV